MNSISLRWDVPPRWDVSPHKNIPQEAVFMRLDIPPEWNITYEWDPSRMVNFTLQKPIIYMNMNSSHPGEITLIWNDFSQCKQFFQGCPTYAGLLFSLDSVCFYNFKTICLTMFNVSKRILYYIIISSFQCLQ